MGKKTFSLKMNKKTLYFAGAFFILLLVGTIAFAMFTGLLPNILGSQSSLSLNENENEDSGNTVADVPFILAVSPSTVPREGSVTFTVSSSHKNTLVTLEAQYVGRSDWIQFSTVTLDGDGACVLPYVCDEAGVWMVHAKTNLGMVSNAVSLKVYGLTLYQQKNVWSVGESYTAALTGTYKNWLVSIWQKNASSDLWFWAGNRLTDANGVIDYGVNTVVIDPSHVGYVKDVIALVSASDPSGQDVIDMFEQGEVPGVVPVSVVDSYVSQGLVVKSNVLTFTIIP
jgi:hypothetical protein